MFAALTRLCTLDALPALPQDWWRAWSLAPATLLPLLALAAWSLAPAARTDLPEGSARHWRLAGLALLAVALVSPLCRLAATLAGAHMAQLMVLVTGCGLLAAGWRAPARSDAGTLSAATISHGLLLWLWHLPWVYAQALQSAAVHVGMTAALALSSFAFWRQVLHAPAARRGAVLVALLLSMAHTGLLGALLTFAATPLYPLQAPGARAWGLTPLMDQQLAGLLMWVPGGLLYLGGALFVLLPPARKSRRARSLDAPPKAPADARPVPHA